MTGQKSGWHFSRTTKTAHWRSWPRWLLVPYVRRRDRDHSHRLARKIVPVSLKEVVQSSVSSLEGSRWQSRSVVGNEGSSRGKGNGIRPTREVCLGLVTLRRGVVNNLHIRPRWPARQIDIDSLALQKLNRIQASLPEHIQIIVTRGYEPAASSLGFARTQFRKLGVLAFSTLYAHRRHEIADIFGANGHNLDGTHIDVSFALEGRRVRLLPLGLFTPLWLQRKRKSKVVSALRMVQTGLRREGFVLHRNATERLQIHCDLRADTTMHDT